MECHNSHKHSQSPLTKMYCLRVASYSLLANYLSLLNYFVHYIIYYAILCIFQSLALINDNLKVKLEVLRVIKKLTKHSGMLYTQMV